MPETNFLTPAQDSVIIKKPKKRSPRKKSKSPAKAEKTIFKLKDNLDLEPVMPKAKLIIQENSVGGEKGLTPARAGGARAGEAKNIYSKIAFSFIALTVILVAAVLYFSFSKVTLVIIPTQEKISDSLSLKVIDKASGLDPEPGEIGGVVRQVPLEQERTFASSGKEILGQEVTGKVTIINNYLKNQPLVATTRLLAPDNKLFRLKNTVNVPADGRVEAEVYADEARPDMAIGASKFTIPGLWSGLQDKIYAVSSQPMEYKEKIKYAIKQSDIDNAVSMLKNNLLANAKKEIAPAYAEYDQLIVQADNNSATLETQGKVGEEKEKFTIKMKTLVLVAAFKSEDVYNLAERKVIARLADDREIVELSRPDMVYALGDFNLKEARAAVNVNFDAKVTLKGGTAVIQKNNLAGLSLEQAKVYLNSLPEVSGYEIKFFPSFIRKMPKLADRIEIVIKK